jgi:hypothetical protein
VSRLGVTLSPAQRVLCLVCFDGVQPGQLDAGNAAMEPGQYERELFTSMFGDVESVDSTLLRWLVWVIGGRSGKSYLGALALLWRALVSDLTCLAPGEEATALIVCPRLELAIHTLRFITGAVKGHPLLKQFTRSGKGTDKTAETRDLFVIERPDGYRVSFAAMPATAGGGAVRGMTLVSAMLDETAFFRDDNFAVNDSDIYEAIQPRVTVPGGFILVSSTPWAEGGILYQLYDTNWGHPVTGLCANVSTGLMRAGDAIIERTIANERKTNPRNAEREYDAKFSATVSTLFFVADTVKAATQVGAARIPVTPGTRVVIFVDASFSTDTDDKFGWAVASSRASPRKRDGSVRRERRLATLHECAGWTVDRKPREMAMRLRDEVCERYGTTHIYIDQFSDRAFQQLCSDVGLFAEIAPWKGGEADDSKNEKYRRIRTALMTEDVELCDQEQLATDIKTCKSKLLPGGGEQIGVPRTRRGHGDVLSAAVGAITQAMDYPGVLEDPVDPAEVAQRAEQERAKREKDAARKASEREAKRNRVAW